MNFNPKYTILHADQALTYLVQSDDTLTLDVKIRFTNSPLKRLTFVILCRSPHTIPTLV